MTEQNTLPAEDATVTAALPPVPQQDTCTEGYDWMEQLDRPWWPIPGFMGQRLGEWPHVCVALYTDRHVDEYGMAVWDNGRVIVRGYVSERARNGALREYVTED